MSNSTGKRIGYACAYTPLALIDAAGFVPARVLPEGDFPDQAGHLMHDNLCPHVKKILDRALANDLDHLDGMIFVNCCDAMRRLSDAWQVVYPSHPSILLDLPVNVSPLSIIFFSGELKRLSATLAKWSGNSIDEKSIQKSMDAYQRLTRLFLELEDRSRKGTFPGGTAGLQEVYNMASEKSADDAITRIQTMLSNETAQEALQNDVPVYMFGNMLPDPDVFRLVESSGARITGTDFCTGSRLFTIAENVEKNDDVFLQMAEGLLSKTPCSRTLDAANPLRMAEDILSRAKDMQVKGIIGHTLKFCDPYISRLPVVRDVLRQSGMPFLLIEGDLSLRSVGQQRTRIEAFIEMLR